MANFRPLLAAHGLTEQQWRVLRVLAEHNGMESKELAERTLMHRPSLTGVIDRLERDGLVERRRHKADGRRTGLLLTRKAKRLYNRIAPESEQEYSRLQARFSNERWEGLYEALQHLVQLNGDRNSQGAG